MLLNYSFIMWLLTPFIAAVSLITWTTGNSLIVEFTILSINSIKLSVPLFLDLITTSFTATVFFISANVLILANIYIEDEIFIKRFALLVCAFISSMALLVFIPSITAMLIGWDGLGLISLLLITLYSSPNASSAGMFTAINNRIGDAIIITSIVLCLEFGSNLFLSWSEHPLITISIIVAALTNSAQFPLSAWLPAAIEAPTPVSALVHSSTLVTAGVFTIIRLYPTLSNLAELNSTVIVIGTVTSLIAGICAITESDANNIVALSTLSQLGFICMSVGLQIPNLALLHILSHAIFKALLLVCVGTLIHFNGHAQDIRQIECSSTAFPITSVATSISILSLSALPLMSGLYSNDSIVEAIIYSPVSLIIVLSAGISVFITSIYSARLNSIVWRNSHSNPINMSNEPIFAPFVNLSIGSTILGAILVSILGPVCFESFNPAVNAALLTTIPLAFSWNLSNWSTNPYNWNNVQQSASSIFHLSELSTQAPLSFITNVSKNTSNIDQSWLELGQTNVTNINNNPLLLPQLLAASTVLFCFYLTYIIIDLVTSVS